MTTVALAANTLRARIGRAEASLREIARQARISKSTVRRFAELGAAQVSTLVKIEAALDSLDNSKGASARSDAHV